MLGRPRESLRAAMFSSTRCTNLTRASQDRNRAQSNT
jgi:hypothetical protein